MAGRLLSVILSKARDTPSRQYLTMEGQTARVQNDAPSSTPRVMSIIKATDVKSQGWNLLKDPGISFSPLHK